MATNDTNSHEQKSNFEDFGLDSRLLRALSKLSFVKPTLVQSHIIPLALSGKDILARARTGSGKTAAYSLPVIQKILKAKENADYDSSSATRALILVPTRELAEQVTKQVNKMLIYCSKQLKIVNVAGNMPVQLQKPILAEEPDIIVATPSKVAAHLESQNLDIRNSLETLVIDEADLILSYGYEEDLQKILSYLPNVYQSFLMSATMTKDVESLKKLILRDPVILNLEEDKDELALLTQYCIRCSEIDKFLLIYVILKLRLIKGKCILFVNDIDRSYRLKLFLEQFSIRSCILNSELPLNSRYHIVEEFNKGIYDYIIATDEDELKGERDEEDETLDNNNSEASKGTKSSRRKRDTEYGVSRGIDFVNVSAVINFDFPTTAKSYTHRIGRTARGDKSGMSLSFIVPKELYGQHKAVGCSTAERDEEIYARVEKQQREKGAVIKPYAFDMKQVEGFRYRMGDALKAVTKAAIKEARQKEVKQEILNSERLKSHFEDNPNDLNFLRHDKVLHPTRIRPHMKHIPSYLMPKVAYSAVNEQSETSDVGHVYFRGNSSNKHRKGRKGYGQRQKNDPLKTFSAGKSNRIRKRQKTS
ncbi:3819_t:CDS:10 [Paraglomus brasilianum]|uniref:ATP-dependent RNA helicase DBP9 n=1 Tax=Paraglomus brasilianum TaxID=144538 RepID=A0A9N8WPA9_9GLOM|nr:3819_t:CDS:10 [Paraglomus brasilianum]